MGVHRPTHRRIRSGLDDSVSSFDTVTPEKVDYVAGRIPCAHVHTSFLLFFKVYVTTATQGYHCNVDRYRFSLIAGRGGILCQSFKKRQTSTHPPSHPPSHLPTCMPSCLPTYLPTYLPTSTYRLPSCACLSACLDLTDHIVAA